MPKKGKGGTQGSKRKNMGNMRKIEFTKEWIIANKIAIQCNNKQEADTICGIFGIPISTHSNMCCFFGVDSSSNYYAVYPHNSVIADGETVIKASEVIAQYEASKRKIIGYIYPFKTINGHKVQDRSIVKKTINDYTLDIGDIRTLYTFPAEMVERWEPVYEEVKPCFGRFEDVLNYGKLKDTDNIVHFGSGYMSVTIGNKKEALNKENGYDFTPEFEQKLKEMGINI